MTFDLCSVVALEFVHSTCWCVLTGWNTLFCLCIISEDSGQTVLPDAFACLIACKQIVVVSLGDVFAL